MSGDRIKGQEITILIGENGALQENLTDIQSFEFTCEFEVKVVGYLGEKTMRKDFIFKGVKGSFEMHVHSSLYFQFVQDVKLRAQRVTNTKFTANGLFAFPNGDTAEIDVDMSAFGEFAHTAKSNGDYFDAKVPWEADDWTQQLTVAA